MIKPALTVAAAVVFGLAACAPGRHQPAGSEADLLEVQRKLSEAEEKIEQLTKRVTLIQIVVDSHQQTLQDPGGDTVAGDMVIDLNPAPAIPATEAEPASSQTLPPVTKMEEKTPVSETTPSESSPKSQEDEAISSELPFEPQEADTTSLELPLESSGTGEVELSETEEKITGPEPHPQYQAAMDVFRNGDYETAADLFEKFARQFPKSDLADNALYWSGECRYTRKDYTGAIEQFRQVIENYPSGSKVPDALLKIGFAYLSLGNKESAATYLKKAVAQYPFSAAGTKAEERLKTLQQ